MLAHIRECASTQSSKINKIRNLVITKYDKIQFIAPYKYEAKELKNNSITIKNHIMKLQKIYM